ncbi:MAG: Rrf2 family transcriptional regulator [Rhizobiaceae bacterium]|nr:Rrf2 family transcriptional regulator [Rhizobiaceae bacterium]MCV0407844.1 Rrf2 family transcriptional regulator [Rhizobiaceae bacterium]
MRLSEGVEAGLHCATALAQLEADAVLPASALAGFHGVSPSYLLKHLKALTHAGILESVSGPSGGYRLARPAGRITLLDVVVAIEGVKPAFRCAEIRQRGPLKLPASTYLKPCAINAAMLKAERAWRAALAATSIADIVREFVVEGDPRATAAACAFLAANRRLQPGERKGRTGS